MTQTRRIFVEKKPGFRVEAESLLRELNENLSLGEIAENDEVKRIYLGGKETWATSLLS